MTNNSRAAKQTDAYPKRAHARSGSRHGVLKAVSLVLAGVLAFGASAAFAGVNRIQNLATKVDVSGLVAPVPGATLVAPDDLAAGTAMNILVLGVDDRSGENGDLSDNATGGMRSDTAMVVHIAADRSRVEVVSIPRDSMVKIPECRTTSGDILPAQKIGMFNSAFARGMDYGGDIASAAACTINTVQANTGLTMNHFVVVDFAGYKGMVDALGGIDINIPEAVDAKKVGGLKLEAGQQTITGMDALKLVRARKGTGWGLEMGSDLSRIERQQAVMDATIATALSKNFLTDLPKLTTFMTAAMTSLTMNPELSNNLLGLATSFKGFSTSDVEFVKLPLADYPADKNRVIWAYGSDEIWANLLNDQQAVAPTTPDATN